MTYNEWIYLSRMKLSSAKTNSFISWKRICFNQISTPKKFWFFGVFWVFFFLHISTPRRFFFSQTSTTRNFFNQISNLRNMLFLFFFLQISGARFFLQILKVKGNFEFKPTSLNLKIDLVSHSFPSEGVG